MFTITLNTEAAAVLLRCLHSGESTCSSRQEELFKKNTKLIMDQVIKGIASAILEDATA